MKVRWRQHEFILVTIIALFTALHYVLRLFNTGVPFVENFKSYSDITALQFITLLIQYGCYVWLNKLVIPKLATPRRRWLPVVNAIGNGGPLPVKNVLLITGRYLLIFLQFIVIIYLVGPVCNFAAFYYTRGFNDPGMANSISSILPSHPQPFRNTFGGFGVTAFMVILYMLYALVRETFIYLIEKQDSRTQYRIIITNQVTLFAVVYFAAFPLLILFSSPSDHSSIGQSTFVMYFFVIPATFTLFLGNIYWLFPLKGDKPFFRSRIVGRLLLLTFLCSLPVIFLQRAQLVGPGSFLLGAWAFQLFVVTPLSWALYRQRKEKILQLRGVEKALERSRADLQFLRSQINPHFLFNILNTLYGTALQEGSERTAEGIQKLGDMMRFMLHDNNLDVIPMHREIEYLQNYIHLQSLRIQSSPNIVITTNLNGSFCNHSIAPMLLIPLVENAFKHGISLVGPSWIDVTLACDEKSIRFLVRNSIHTKQDNDTERDRSGIGLKNVSERLALLYTDKHAFSAEIQGKEFIASLYVQL